MTNKEMMQRDLNVLWHPCTQMKDHENLSLIPIKRAEGIYLEDFEGKRYIDAISSWWVNLFGHANKTINEAVKAQLDTLEHVILAGFSHEPIIRLSERLVKLAPQGLTKCFYADNGSSAIEVALKMSYHYFKNSGQRRDGFVSLSNSYHGETIGALSVGDVALYKETYDSLLLDTYLTPSPKDQSEEAAHLAAAALEELLSQKWDKIAAFIVEPLVQGAGGMQMYHPLFLELSYAICKKYDVHFIADEVMTGFGRTGSMFAVEQAGITPDFLCLSKGITGGYLPLSVVLTKQHIYDAFYCDYNEYKAFLHSHSYTGNALACAAANATLDIFEQEGVIEKNIQTSTYMYQKLEELQTLEQVESIRQCGMISALTLKEYDPQRRLNLEVYNYCLEQGVLIRPLGKEVYVMPPYIISNEELDTVFHVMKEAIARLEI